ncbi:hypothetical protein BGZ93_010759, partial [Podila epicladia]
MRRRSIKRILLPNRLASKGKSITYSIRSSFDRPVLVTTRHPTHASSRSQSPDSTSSPVIPQPAIHVTSNDPNRKYDTNTHPRVLTPPCILGQVISSLSPISVDASFWPSFMTHLLPPTPLLTPLASSSSSSSSPSSSSSATKSSTSGNAPNPHHDDPNPEIQQLSSAPTLLLQQMASLARHIAFQGFIQGTGTDIVLYAFGKSYHLHRLILAQSPFFDSMMHGPWKERAQTQIDLTLNDPNITLEGFEIALGRMYGIWTVEADDDLAYVRQQRRQEDEQEQKQPEFTVVFAGTQALYASRLTPANAFAVLATAVYLGVESLCAQCTAYIVRTLSASRVIDYVRLSHRHSYHPWSSQIADACHTFLCRNGFDDPRVQCLGVFERLPAEWLVKVIGSDTFWVPSEWDRYLFCRRIVERRRRMRHRRETVRRKGSGRRCKGEWDLQGCLEQHIRAGDGCYDDDPEEVEEEEEEGGEDEEAVYERLFSTSIVYMHMTLEQLQLILNDHDPWTGRPFTLSHVIHESFWWQTEFRTLIEGADRENAALGLTSAARVIPQSDAMGGHCLRDSDPVPDKDARAVAPAILPFNDPKRLLDESETSVFPQLYSACSPFRFSVQFENVAQLDVGVKMSSDSFYYAGESDDENNVFDQDEELFQVDELSDLAKDTVPIEESFSCFADRRESTRTWFRVYAASIGPLHQVTHFQAAPENFQLSHSWGWVAPELYTACFLPELSQPPLDLETVCRGHGHCDRRTKTRTRTRTKVHPSPTPGNQSAVYDMDDEDEQETCDCEARVKYGPHHHHRPPVHLKLSFVMGH